MADTNEALKIWQALQPMIDKEIAEQTESCVRAKKMIVKRATQENENGKGVNIGVMEPYGDKVIIPSGTQLSNVNPGEPVWVYWYLNNASTMHVALTGDGSQGTADTDRLAEMLEKEIADREAALDGLKEDITKENEKIYSYIDKTSSHLRLEFTDELNGLRSYLEMTASHLRIEFQDDLNSMRSYLEMTASHLRIAFEDGLNSMRSYLELTASHLRLEFYNDMDSLRSYLEMTASHLRVEFADDINSLRSYLELTASALRLAFENDVESLRSYLELTASHLRLEFDNDMESLRSYLELTASHLRLEFDNDMESLRSYLEMTASHLRVEFADDVNSLRSYLEMTASALRLAFENDINSLRSYVDIQAGKIEMNVAATDENSSILRQAGLQLDPNGVLIYANTGDNALGTKYIQSAKEIITYGKWKEDNPGGTRAEYETYIAQNAGGIVMSYVAPNNIKNLINMSSDGVLIQANQVNLRSYLGKSEVVITDDRITIGSQSISLAGYVTLDRLAAGTTYINIVRTSNLFATNAEIGGRTGSWQVPMMGNATVDGSVFSSSQLKLDHYHAITAEASGGVVTITLGAAQSTPGTDFFNIADTQFYKDGVAAARRSGETRVKTLSTLSAVTLSANGSHSYSGISATTNLNFNGTSTEKSITVNANAVYSDGWQVGYNVGAASATQRTATSAGTVTLTSSDTGSAVSKTTTVTYDNSSTTTGVPIIIDATEAFNAGAASVKVSSWSVDKSGLPTVTVKVTLSNGVVRSHSFNV